VIEPAIPGLPGKHSNPELNRVDQDYSSTPRMNARQFHRWPQSLGENTTSSDSKDYEYVHALIILQRMPIAVIDKSLNNYRSNR